MAACLASRAIDCPGERGLLGSPLDFGLYSARSPFLIDLEFFMTLLPSLRKSALLLACAALMSSALVGCSTSRTDAPTWAEAKNDPLLAATNRATDSILNQLGAQAVAPAEQLSHPIIVGSMQNISDLEKPAPLGRLLGEAIAARVTQRGLPVVEVKLAGNLKVTDQGQTLLSDQAREIAQAHKAQIVIVGSWTEGGKFVYVTIKAVRAEDGLALASQSFAMPKEQNVQLLLITPKKATANNFGF